MSKYTTGEMAKLCGVSVRTVQYYDSRSILTPSELSEGGRRLYSEEDLSRLKIICFLRELGLPINSIGRLLSEEHPEQVISILLDEQSASLQREIKERQTRLDKLSKVKDTLKTVGHFSVASIGDIAHIMENKKNMRQLHGIILITGIPLAILQWTSLLLWIVSGIWWPFLVYVVVIAPYAIWISRFYFKRVIYICPQCHGLFKPPLKEAFWARHTPALREATCTCCGYHGFCVETYDGEVTE